MIRRRAFVIELVAPTAACALAGPLSAAAQPAPKLPRVALVFNVDPLADMAGPDPINLDARNFVHGLRDLGYFEGRNIIIERRSAEGEPERLPGLLKELVATRVDVIVAAGPAAQQAQRATETIPIVALVDAPDAIGMTQSLGRPSRNITGMTAGASQEMDAKRLQLLKEAAPRVVRVAVIDHPYVDSRETPGTHLRRGVIESAARTLGVTPIPVGIGRAEAFEAAFARIVSEGAEALIVIGPPLTSGQRQRIIDFAARQKLPAIYLAREFVDSGGLMSYGLVDDSWRKVTTYVDKILKGAKPTDLPWQQPTRYELVINLNAAKAIGVTIPRALLLRADEVIE